MEEGSALSHTSPLDCITLPGVTLFCLTKLYWKRMCITGVESLNITFLKSELVSHRKESINRNSKSALEKEIMAPQLVTLPLCGITASLPKKLAF